MISKKSAVRWALLAVTIGSALFGRCSTYISEANVITSGWPPCGPSPVTGYDSGSFYGYISSGNGAGDEAFERCLAMMRTNRWNRPLMVIYGHDTCSRCDVFASAANYFPTWRGNTKNIRAVKGYFRGKNDDSGPKACKDAYDFLIAHGVKKSEVCHGVGLYGEYEDGEKPFKFFPLNLNGDPHAIKDNFIATAKEWCENYISNYSNHLVTVTWGFKPGQYEALPEVEALSVIIERTKQLDKADTNLLEVVYADGTTVTNQIEYAAGDGLEREIRIPLRDAEGGSYWTQGAEVKLTLFSAKGRSAAKPDPTKTIRFVTAAEAVNSPLYPSLPGKTDLAWGEWTPDGAAATSKAHAANSYLQPDTNEVAVVEPVRISVEIAPSNRYDVVYTNDIAFFSASKTIVPVAWNFAFQTNNVATTNYVKDVESFEKVGEDEAYPVTVNIPFSNQVETVYLAADGATTTNVVEQTASVPITNLVFGVSADGGATNEWGWARVPDEAEVTYFVTNITVRTKTNEAHRVVGSCETNFVECVWTTNVTAAMSYRLNQKGPETKGFEVTMTTNYPSARVYAVMPQTDGTSLTNFHSAVLTEKTCTFSATNLVTTLPCDDGHPEPTSVCGSIADSFAGGLVHVDDEDAFYVVSSNWYEVIQQPCECYGTNRTFYTFLDNAVTNEDVAARLPVLNVGETTVTNFIAVALTNAEHAVTETVTTFSNEFTTVVLAGCTNFYFSVTTNAYQYGDQKTHEGYAGRSEAGIQSAVLRFTGGVVWDDDAIAFARFLETDAFKAWCARENVATLFIETAEPGTGASLFSYNVASNGNNGALNISRRGFSIAECAAYAPALTNAEPFKLELERPDGTVAGEFAAYSENGSYSTEDAVTENLARLSEFLKLLDDRSENKNNDPKTTTDTFAYGESALDRPVSTLQMSDKIDVFRVTDVPVHAAIAVELGTMGSDGAGVVSEFVAGSVPVPPFGKDSNGKEVWTFTAAQTNDLYLKVQAWTNATAATIQRGGASEVRYIPTVSEASVCSGKVGFVSADLDVQAIKGDKTFTIAVERTGYTGAATATVSVDAERSTVPSSSYVLVGFSQGQKTFTWADLESGRKTFDVRVKNVTWATDVSNLVFKVTCTGAELDVAKSTCRLGLRQEDDPNDPLGSVAITAPSVPENVKKLYVKTGDRIDFTVRRFGSGEKNVARGLAVATLTAREKSSTFDPANRVEWKSYQTGEQTLTYVASTDIGNRGYLDDVVTLKAVGTNNVNITVATSNKVHLCVLSSLAPGFVWPDPSREAVQYVEFAYEASFSDYPKDQLEPEQAVRISGDALPSGITASVTEDGLVFAGKPTKPTGCKPLTSVWWVRFKRKDKATGSVYSMPVTFTITVRPLSESSGSCGAGDAVNAGFATSRNWTDLPLTNGAGRLVGLLNLSATDKGAINARYRKLGGKTVAFPRANIDVWPSGEEGEYVVHANLANKGFTCDIDFFKDLSVAGSVFDDETQETYGFALPKGSKVWSKDHKADRWQGYYTLAFPKLGAEWDGSTRCFGVPTASARLATSATALANGKMTYAVTLPNGKSASGSAMLTPTADGAEATTLPIFVSNSSETFAALVGVMTNAGEKVSVEKAFEIGGSVPYWKHVESKLESASYENDYSVVGVRIAGLGRKFDWSPFEPRTEEDLVLKTKAINLTSGVVSGTMRDAANRSVSWKGVALPGFDPFVFGAFWRNVSEGGRTIRSGGAVEFVEKQAE